MREPGDLDQDGNIILNETQSLTNGKVIVTLAQAIMAAEVGWRIELGSYREGLVTIKRGMSGDAVHR